MPQRNRVAEAVFDVIFYDISIFYANYLGVPFLSASNLKCDNYIPVFLCIYFLFTSVVSPFNDGERWYSIVERQNNDADSGIDAFLFAYGSTLKDVWTCLVGNSINKLLALQPIDNQYRVPEVIK